MQLAQVPPKKVSPPPPPGKSCIRSWLQWRSEGNWRPGAKLNFAPPLKKFFKMISKCI